MRYILPVLALIASPVFADDFVTQMHATDVTVYPRGAEVTFKAALDLPAGEHRVLMPFGEIFGALPRITTSSDIKIVAINFLDGVAYNRDTILNEPQRIAKTQLDGLADALSILQSDITAQEHLIAALDMQNGFLSSISGAKLGDADPDQLRAITQMIGQEASALVVKKRHAHEKLTEMQDNEIGLKAEFSAADDAFKALIRWGENTSSMLALTVVIDRPVSTEFNIVTFEPHAEWSTFYELFLKSGDDPNLRIVRRISVENQHPWSWQNVALTLSTAAPMAQSEPSYVRQDHVSIFKPAPMVSLRSATNDMAAAPMMEPVVMEEASSMPEFESIEGLSIEYVYPRHVTLAPNQPLLLDFGSFDLPVTTRLLANPRRDETAFMMGEFTNDIGSPMLPGNAQYFRDDVLVGGGHFEMLPAGGTSELPFGTMEGIRLDYKPLRKDTGDTGLISVSNTREEVSEFTIENLMSEPQDVRALFALPFSQQENLEISTRLRPNPDETNVDDERGVAAWDLTLAAGEKKTVRITTQMAWPEGMELNYRP